VKPENDFSEYKSTRGDAGYLPLCKAEALHVGRYRKIRRLYDLLEGRERKRGVELQQSGLAAVVSFGWARGGGGRGRREGFEVSRENSD
jgi:hypothetical protein